MIARQILELVREFNGDAQVIVDNEDLSLARGVLAMLVIKHKRDLKPPIIVEPEASASYTRYCRVI